METKNTVKKKDFIKKFAEIADMTQINADIAYSAFLESIEYFLLDNRKIKLLGFGIFSTKKTGKRFIVDPQTGEKRDYPERTLPHFIFSKKFKDKFLENEDN